MPNLAAAIAVSVAILGSATPAFAAREDAIAATSALVSRDFVSGALAGGGRYLVRPSAGAPVAAIELWFRAPATGFEGPLPGLGQLAAQSVAASVPITGTQLGVYVQQFGGRISVASYPDSIAISALVPSTQAATVIRAMTAAYFTPVLSAAGVQTAKSDLAESEQLRSFDSENLLRDSLAAQLFRDGPAHYPLLGAPGTVANVPFERVRSYAMRAFRAQNAVLVVTGSVDPSVIASAVPGRSAPAGTDGAQPEPNIVSNVAVEAAPATKAGIEAGFGLGWIGPSIADEADATALDFVADYLFRPETGIVSQQVATNSVSVNGQFVTYHDPGIMLVSVTGANVDAARPVVDRELARLRKPLDASVFAAARDAFVYHILSDLQTPGEIADTFGWYSVEGSPEYAPGAGGMRGKYFGIASSLTPASVASTVTHYLAKPPATVNLISRSTPAVEKKS